MGPGDTLVSALIASTYGASHCYLLDTGAFARTDMRPYRTMAEFLGQRGMVSRDWILDRDLASLLESCRASYATEGLASLTRMPSESLDWIWSQAALEHVRKSEFRSFARELRRVMRPNGIASHRVDLGDHLSNALNNLRFSESLWETNWMANSGFYTNRLRCVEMCDIFSEAGFDVEIVGVDRWRELPTPISRMALRFRQFDPDELRISAFDVILRPRLDRGLSG